MSMLINYLSEEIAKTNNNELTSEFDTFVNLYFKHTRIADERSRRLMKENIKIRRINNMLVKKGKQIEFEYNQDFLRLEKENEELKEKLKKKNIFNFFKKIKKSIKRRNTI